MYVVDLMCQCAQYSDKGKSDYVVAKYSSAKYSINMQVTHNISIKEIINKRFHTNTRYTERDKRNTMTTLNMLTFCEHRVFFPYSCIQWCSPINGHRVFFFPYSYISRVKTISINRLKEKIK